MALLTTQPITSISGTKVNYTAAASGAGDQINSPGSNIFLHVKNGGASSITVSLVVGQTAWNAKTVPPTTVAVPAGEDRFIPVVSGYANADNRAVFTYSAVTSVTVAAIQTA